MKKNRNLRNIAIIPARGGSKRIPRKNIKNFLGEPIINYSIKAAFESNCFSEIMVSTDDKEIAEVARESGAKVPFLRSKQASSDYATTADVLDEVIKAYQKLGEKYDYICCVYPTAPLILSSRIVQGLKKLLQSGADSIMPVVRFSFPVQRALKIKKDRLAAYSPEDIKKRSQDCLPLYHDAGQFYWIKTGAFLKEGNLLTKSTVPLMLSELEVQDIDNESDWALAELKYNLLKRSREQQVNGKRKIILLKKDAYKNGGYSIVPLRSEDMLKIKDWRNQQIDVLRQKRKLSDADQERYYKDIVEPSFSQLKPNILLFSFLFRGECIGYGGLTNIDWQSMRAELSFLLDPVRADNKALYAKEMEIFISLIKEMAIKDLRINRIYTETFDIREHHISILEKNAFLFEGRMREHVRVNGKYVDSLIHGLLRRVN